MKTKHSGFTLIELLVVILIISILSVTVFVALNPSKRFADARDARRTSDVNSILTAVHEYIVDNGGVSPSGLSATERQLGTATTGCDVNCLTPQTPAACLDLSTSLSPYLKTIPTDPKVGTAAITGYKIVKDANGMVTVTACASESAAISVTR
ncbi:MAG TPA: type II secretion system protein [Candidatus Woesebacteria bacterium]|nr:type II secretion system protein [Candidatus Woesebacteria bacterium]